MSKDPDARPIIIKKVIKGGHGHHGGAWKVAYADFVTAMMAFFLLLWLLNVTTDEQKNGIAEYFTPESVSASMSGANGVLGGQVITEEVVNRSSRAASVIALNAPPTGTTVREEKPEATPKDKILDNEEFEKEKKRREEEAFKDAEKQIREAIEQTPELKALANNLIIDMTPDGLRIQIVDQENRPMFPLGSAKMFDYTRQLLKKIGSIVKALPNQIAVTGHTDSYKYATGAGYTNWELSSDRANATRRVLLDSGFDETRVNRVMGKADKEHLFRDNPKDPRNRRISIILLRDSVAHHDGSSSNTNTGTTPAPQNQSTTPETLYR